MKPLSILLIEDDLVDRMAITNLVEREKLPYEFVFAGTVLEARHLLENVNYDLIIADYKLPDGTTLELTELFKDRLVIFTTGGGDEETAARALQLGVRDYLIKDVDRGYLKLLPYRIDIALKQWQAEERLRESEWRYRDLVENANDLILVVLPDRAIHFVNRAWLHTLGYTEAETVGRNIFEFIHPDSSEAVLREFRKILDGETIGNIDAQLVAKDGKPVYVSGNLNCLFEKGNAVLIRGIFHNVTLRRQREAEREHLIQEQKRLIGELQTALNEVQVLSNLLPICAWCKKVRDDSGYWEDVSEFFAKRDKISWSHGVCPDCAEAFLNSKEEKPAVKKTVKLLPKQGPAAAPRATAKLPASIAPKPLPKKS